MEVLDNGMVFTTWITKIQAQNFQQQFLFFSPESIKNNREKVLLYHCRMGHPSFRVIKQLFPILFKILNVEILHYEVCELTKHKHVPFSFSNKMSTFPFYLVHTDVLGPSNIPNISGARWLSHLLMIVLGFTYLNKNHKLVMWFLNLSLWLKINLVWVLRGFGLIIPRIVLIIILILCVKMKITITSLHVLKHPNKMALFNIGARLFYLHHIS